MAVQRGVGVELIRADEPDWDDRLADVQRDFYHTAGYHTFAQGSGHGEPYLIVVRTQRQGMAWPYLLRRVAEVAGLSDSTAADVHSVYGYPGPLAWGCRAGDAFLAVAWAEILSIWREQRAVAAFTRFHPLLDNASLVSGLAAPHGARSGTAAVVAAGPTVSVDCTLDDEAATAAYARPLRQHIAAGRRAGLATVHDRDWDELGTFIRLYVDTMIRNRAAPRYILSEGDLARLRGALADRLHLLVTFLGDTVAAAGLFTEFDGIVQAHLTATDATLLHLSPSKILLDDARRWARERGNTVLHLGGGRGGREDSLFRFKREFSPRRHLFYTGRWVLDPDAYDEFVRARDRVGPGRDLLDPSFFPAYRAPAVGPAETQRPAPEATSTEVGPLPDSRQRRAGAL
jgi:hypothetical protein